MQGLQKLVVLATAMAFTAPVAFAQHELPGQISIPYGQAFAIERNHERSGNILPAEYATELQQVHVPGAPFIKLHFARLRLPEGVVIEISSPDGHESYSYSATQRDAFTFDIEQGDDGENSFWAMSISGDTAIVRARGDLSGFDPSVHVIDIDSYLGTPRDKKTDPSPPVSKIETECGESELYDAVCWADSYPDEYERATPVAMLITSSGKECTAWRVGSDNRMFTARHCIASQSQLDGAEIWFNYEMTVCGGDTPGSEVKVTGDQLLKQDYHLDYALFTVNDFTSISRFGNLGLDVRNGDIGEGIFIPQHGLGNPRQLAIESDMNGNGMCQIDDNEVDSFEAGSDIGYMCDTMTGSSGSPVISSSSGKVLALHHWGGCLNSGTKISYIWPQVSPFFNDKVPKGNGGPGWAAGNEPPIADFSSSCDGLACSLDGRESEDPDGEIVSFTWDLGNGESASGSDIAYEYEEPGIYTVKLIVQDDEGATAAYQRTVSTALPNEEPVAKFSTSCIDNVCTFDAGSSKDPDGTITEWAWSLGDGNTATGSDIEHTYQEGGSYTISLTVEDNDEATDSTNRTVTLSMPNEKPEAAFEVSCTYSDCAVDAGSSSDADGTVVNYSWNFGDGNQSSGKTGTHSYDSSGTYSITLTVVDDRGSSDSASQQVSVELANKAPVARFTGVCEELRCTFDAGDSTDPDGEVVRYIWSLGDGETSTGKTIEHNFEQEGDYSVRLTVQDNSGSEDSQTRAFSVSAPPDQIFANFSVDCEELKCVVDAGSGSEADDSTISYDWNFGDGETGTGRSVTHHYAVDGDYTVTLKVTGSDKTNNSHSKAVKVLALPELELSVVGIRKSANAQATLTWSGATSDSVEVLRDGQLIKGTINSGKFLDSSLKGFPKTANYQLCESGSDRCSEVVFVKFDSR